MVEQLAVVVVNYGTHALLEENLDRSLGAEFQGTVWVVDNYLSAGERQSIMRVCAHRGWECLLVDSNEGFGAAVNRGAEVAISRGARELLVLNPDAWLDMSTILALQAQVREDPMLLLAPRVLRPDGRLYSEENDLYLDSGDMLWRRLRNSSVRDERVRTWVSGACFVVSSHLWRASGGFDPEYFLYWEDVDLAHRVAAVGGTVRVDERRVAVHDEGSSQRSRGVADLKSPLYFYFNARNRLLYAAKHLSLSDQRRWLRNTPRTALRLALQGGRRQFLHPSRNLMPVLRGVLDGVRYLRSSRRV